MTERAARKLRAGSAIGMSFVVAGGGAASGTRGEDVTEAGRRQRKEIARKAAKARWDEKRREEP